ncbi:hypothetical protein H2509_00070 [Stappia sp. F7233]|uniref:Uncharacterized protein n=1 Tax=Stappia albiluteola TaxID=2758565 RepID=A0A839A8Q5_9HYPH|nr:hypothetical protein [Stappia albiluteola]MBA5775515.1 hypothetical protein [Stappia albiluteola]
MLARSMATDTGIAAVEGAAHVALGLKAPVVLTSRAETMPARLGSIALAAWFRPRERDTGSRAQHRQAGSRLLWRRG